MWFYRYRLIPRRSLSALAGARPREGALLRVGEGVADIHPWPELGDAPLDEQLAILQRGETTPLTRQSLRFAAIDGEARRRGKSLFDGITIPMSHWPGDDPPATFDTAKVKSAANLPDRVRLRIDFNATLAAETFERLAAELPRDRIDFVEDPCPYDAATWRVLRERTGLRLALDRTVQTEGVDVIVVKPAVQDIDDVLAAAADVEVVITSYMDHPVGQLAAAFAAARHAQRVSPRCGLFTHVLYEPDAFTEAIRADGARLLAPAGTGVGFDDLLERLPWRKLA